MSRTTQVWATLFAVALGIFGLAAIRRASRKQEEIIARMRRQQILWEEEQLRELPYVPEAWYVYVFWSTASDYAKAEAIEQALEQYTGQAECILKIPVTQLFQGQCKDGQGHYLPASEVERLFPGSRQSGEYPITYVTKLSVDGRQSTVLQLKGELRGEALLPVFNAIDELAVAGY